MTRNKFIVALLFMVFAIQAQDLSKIDVSKLTPEQIEMYKKYMSFTKVSSTQLTTTEERKMNNDAVSSTKTVVPNRIFGSYLFQTESLTFEPQLNIPTPQNYIVGAYDEILLDISGLHDANYKLKVSTEGTIRIPNVGPVKVAGKSIETISESIKNEMSKYYQGVNSGQTKINISLGNIRSIKVVVTGEAVRPGTYTLPSLATAFNALYACGGPNEIGSYRSVSVIRAGKVISKLDVYGLLIDGIALNNISLKDNDIIRIEPYLSQVKMEGAVKRPLIFEMKQGESLQRLIDFAGGFSDNADKAKLRVFRYLNKGRNVIDVLEKDFSRFIPQSGDSIVVPTTSEMIQDYQVFISGAVRKSGVFSLSENQTLKELILSAQGFTEMALVDSIEIIRIVKNQNDLKSSAQKSIVMRTKVNKELNGKDDGSNIILQNGDHVIVRSIPGFEPLRIIRIDGEIMLPGNYSILSKSERISDVIKRAGGLTKYAFPEGAFLIRSEKRGEMEQKLDKYKKASIVKSFENNKNKTIDINALKYSGLTQPDDLVKFDSLQSKFSTGIEMKDIAADEDIVGLDLKVIMDSTESNEDFLLQDGDKIFIPRKVQTVRIMGQVIFPTIVSYDESLRMEDYILKSGGFTENAKKNNIIVLYANGSVKGTKRFLFFKSYPDVRPGASIIVSEKPIKLVNKMSVGETIGILSSTVSMAAIVYSIISNTSKP